MAKSAQKRPKTPKNALFREKTCFFCFCHYQSGKPADRGRFRHFLKKKKRKKHTKKHPVRRGNQLGPLFQKNLFCTFCTLFLAYFWADFPALGMKATRPFFFGPHFSKKLFSAYLGVFASKRIKNAYLKREHRGTRHVFF